MNTTIFVLVLSIIIIWATYKVIKAFCLILNQFLINIFGRSRSPIAKLIEPSELTHQPWPSSRNDETVRYLSEYDPASRLISESPCPKWKSIWLEKSQYCSNSTNISEIESLFFTLSLVKLPYEILDQPSTFNTKDLDDIKRAQPSEPTYVQEYYPSPILSLPLWKPPLEFLNYYVRASHSKLIDKFKQLDNRRFELEMTAKDLNHARMEAWDKACERYKTALTQFEAYREKRKKELMVFEKERNVDLEPLRQARTLIMSNDPEGVVRHFELVLRTLLLPAFVPRQWMIRFEPETKTLLVEYQFPEISRLEIVRNVQQRNGLVTKPISQKDRKTIIPKIQPALCLRIARELAEADSFGIVEAIAVNGWVDFFERTTGQPKRAYCASLIAKKEILLSLRLETADPIAAFNHLRGVSAGESYETTPVMPSLRFQTDDPRFIESRETIEKIAKGENLAAMDWEDFEHLVRELFEREFAANGAEVKITRASRDQGVDAIIFDPDPLKGGKIVIQAKRYTLPVDVSAVRDLYGTVINEGANTGILVTTSHYGQEAYEFAQNKNLKLVNGAQLLGLLDKAGYSFRIDLAEARALAAKL